MKLKFGILFFLVSFGLQVNAQNNELIIGKWAFKDLPAKEKASLDSTGLKMMNSFFGEMTMYYTREGRYKLFVMGSLEIGSWSLGKKEKSIELVSDKGVVASIGIEELTETQLVVKMQKGSFIMEKVEVTPEDELGIEPLEIEVVSATLEQVAKTWYVKEKVDADLDDSQKEMVKEFLQGTFIKLANNGSFQAQIIGFDEKAKWEFGPDNTSIIIIFDDTKQIWNISSIDEEKMVLIKGNSSAKWVFTIEQ